VNQLDRLNRVIVTVLGLLLVAAGGYGLVRSFNWQDVLGEGAEDDPFLLDGVREAFAENDWLWWLVAIGSLLVAWVGWRWLRLQLLPSPSVQTLHLPTSDRSRTELPAAALSEAVARDLEADPDITTARVRVVGSDESPELDVRVGVGDQAAAPDVRSRIESEVLPRARWALQREDLRATVRLRLGDPTERVVA
jgi:hypothetical protein